MAEKSIKISEEAHKALGYTKGLGVKQGVYASIAILEAVQRDYPDIYALMKKQICEEENFKLTEIEKK